MFALSLFCFASLVQVAALLEPAQGGAAHEAMFLFSSFFRVTIVFLNGVV